jgi:hypothetical protein
MAKKKTKMQTKEMKMQPPTITKKKTKPSKRQRLKNKISKMELSKTTVVEAKGVEGTLMDTVIGNSYMYDACVTMVSSEVTKAPGFEGTLMDTVFRDLYTYKACPTVVSLEVADTSTAETFQATAMISSPREWGAEAAMVDIVIGHASMDEVLLAMLHWESLKQSLLNLHSYSRTLFSSFCLVCIPLHSSLFRILDSNLA